jgi:hypothetical protein
MTEREEILAQFKAVRRAVATFAQFSPFDVKTSRYLDWLDERIEQMESEE